MTTISVDAELKMQNDSVSTFLTVIIKFKDPNKVFKVKRVREVETTWLEDVSTHRFYTNCISWLDNDQKVKDTVVDMVENYFEGRKVDVEIKEMKKQIKTRDKKYNYDIEI